MTTVSSTVVETRKDKEKRLKQATEEEEYARVMLARSEARQTLANFSRYIEPLEPPAAHHELLCNAWDDVIEGRLRRLMVFMPPGSAKSTYSSVRAPAYYLGRFPKRSIICGSYGEGLSTTFGRKVRNTVASKEYGLLFDTRLSEDSRAKGEWETQEGGSYYACGVGSGVTGRRADLGLIDDPVKGRKDADSELVRNDTWEWYLSDFLTRLKPGGAQVIIQCMTGDTFVTMSDGSYKYLKDIKVGDNVATYENGKIGSSKVLNWKNQGLDCVFKIKTSSGIIARANERHPFLVEREGKLRWVRLKNMSAGDRILRVIGENIEALNAPMMDVENQPSVKDYVHRIITKNDGQTATVLHHAIRKQGVTGICGIATGLMSKITKRCSKRKEAFARFVNSLPERMSALIGEISYALITATTQTRFADSYVTTATLPLGMERQRKSYCQPQNTYETALDTVLEITKSGYEDVFDVQVDRTENFIANGLISHNTRWHEDDLSGRILPSDWDGESGEFKGFDGQMWTVICLPAQARENDILGREVDEWLWPQWFTPEFWEETKRAQTSKDVRNWNALYQQIPQPDTGVFFKREWFKRYTLGEEPKLTLYGASDCAVTDNAGDFTEHGIGGFDKHEDLYFIDWWSGQVTMDVWIESEFKLAKRHNISAWVKEGGIIRRACEPYLKKAKREKKVYFRSEWITSGADKAANCRSFQALAAEGKVYIPRCEWGDALLNQVVKFIPNTNFKDDKVDVCGLFGRILDQTYGPYTPVEEKTENKDEYGFDEEPQQNWKTA